ncbi:hypothetical protein QYE76_018493 [Lolium multiflorum]|uniref:Myb-like domain-containing protein n=1 Tax=Lolium multiflorum TaxID=4521 RepID=A0AAD8QJT5_LOLMU|nr:hypothetical protein QYE76_018493 [Lolium multiflorum]
MSRIRRCGEMRGSELKWRATASSGGDRSKAPTATYQRLHKNSYIHGDEEARRGGKVNAWLFNSKDSVAGNCKTGTSFWGQIATFNSTSDPSRHRTSKQLKDHWNAYNKEVSLFNAYHIQETNMRQSGADDAMVMKAAMERYANDKRGTQPFRKHHWWDAVKNEAKWKGQHGLGSGTDSTSKRSRLGPSGRWNKNKMSSLVHDVQSAPAALPGAARQVGVAKIAGCTDTLAASVFHNASTPSPSRRRSRRLVPLDGQVILHHRAGARGEGSRRDSLLDVVRARRWPPSSWKIWNQGAPTPSFEDLLSMPVMWASAPSYQDG